MKRVLLLACVGLVAASPLSAQELKLRATLNGNTDKVYSVAFSPDGKTLASGSFDRTARLWNVANGNNTATYEGHPYLVSSVAFSPNGKTLACGAGGGAIKLRNLETGIRYIQKLLGHVKLGTTTIYTKVRPNIASLAWHRLLWRRDDRKLTTTPLQPLPMSV